MGLYRTGYRIFSLILVSFLVMSCAHSVKKSAQNPNRSLYEALQRRSVSDASNPSSASSADTTYASIDSRVALEEARKLVVQGLQSYSAKNFNEAKEALDSALLLLQNSEIPEEMKVLPVLGVNLPDPYKGYDLINIMDQLDKLSGRDAEKDDRTFIECNLRRMFLEFGEPFPEEDGLETLVDEVNNFIAYYQNSARDFYEYAYLRLHKYRPLVSEIFREKGLPEDLIFMAFVESGFKTKALSRASALGIWQFIAATARRYDLKVTHRFDERLDPIKATIAAREYLLDLIGIFGSKSFLLAMAAYNAGEQKIANSLRKLDNPFTDRTFWHIRNYVAAETREYIPRILAAAMIAKDPQRFGFNLPTLDEMDSSFDVMIVPRPTSLSSLASSLGVTVEQLVDDNPDLTATAGKTPVNNFPIYIPKTLTPTLTDPPAALQIKDAIVARLQEPEPEPEPEPAPEAQPEPSPKAEEKKPVVTEETKVFDYVVQKGDSLKHLATNFGVSEAKIRAVNPNMDDPEQGDIVSIPTGEPPLSRINYKVKRGDTLYSIAKRYSVTSEQIAKWNTIKPPYSLTAGSEMNIYTSQGASGGGVNKIVYEVQRGNYLFSIAEMFKVETRQIMAWNKLARGSIYPGQKLVVYTDVPVYVQSHHVKAGETIATIAPSYGVNTKDIMTANGLSKKSALEKGQELKIYTFKP